MKKIFITFCLLAFFAGANLSVSKAQQTAEPIISITPNIIFPGDPILIIVNSALSPKEIFFDTKKLAIVNYNGKPSALIGVSLEEKNLSHYVKVTFANGSAITEPVTLTPRVNEKRQLDIPEKLGGNTKKAEKQLLSNLSIANNILNALTITKTNLWTKPFTPPLDNPEVTYDYGYTTLPGNYSIAHKGTDYHAPKGTSVMAMNDGKVVLARRFIVYGNTIVIDHGLGIQTLYMHLSEIDVKKGSFVKAGQVIGLSGDTGNAEKAHLHLSIKINKISIDPVVFLELFK